MSARRRRERGLKRRAAVLSIGLFALLWAMVGGQLALGQDPVLGSNGATGRKTVSQSARSQPSDSSGEALAIDPVTGQIVLVPSSEAQQTGEAPQSSAPQPAPVVSSTS